MNDHVWMRNPATGGVWACPAGLVKAYLARGWEPSDAPTEDDRHLYDPEPESPAPDPNPEASGFEGHINNNDPDDPGEHTIPTTPEEQ